MEIKMLLGLFLVGYLGYMWLAMIVSYLFAWTLTVIFKTPRYMSHVFGIFLLYFGFIGFVIGAVTVAGML